MTSSARSVRTWPKKMGLMEFPKKGSSHFKRGCTMITGSWELCLRMNCQRGNFGWTHSQYQPSALSKCNARTEEFLFQLNISNLPFTTKGRLSPAAVCDSLGFVQRWQLSGKILPQRLCKKKFETTPFDSDHTTGTPRTQWHVEITEAGHQRELWERLITFF